MIEFTTTEYHNKFFPNDTSWKQLAYRTCAISRLEGVFGCPKRPWMHELEVVVLVKVLSYYVLLGKDHVNKQWHELAISNDKTALLIWKDLNYAGVVAKA